MVAMNVRNIKVQMKSDMFGALSEMFFLSKCHIRGVVLDSDKLIFTCQNFFLVGGLHITAISSSGKHGNVVIPN